MGWEVVFAPRSESDLAKIVSYISKDDPAAAVRFGETLISKAESLTDTPKMGPLLPGKPSTRFLPVAAYLIIYRPDERRKIVRILRLWHSARCADRQSNALAVLPNEPPTDLELFADFESCRIPTQTWSRRFQCPRASRES